MTFSTGVVPASSTISTTYLTLIEDALTEHAAWTYVEEVTVGAYRFRVWKNSGTYNSWGQDFFIAIRIPTTPAASLAFIAFEQYRTSDHALLHPAASPDSGQTTAGAHSCISDTWQTMGVTAARAFPVTLTGSSTAGTDCEYFILVTNDTLQVASYTYNAGGYPVCVGLFEPFFPSHPTEFPLFVGNIPAQSTSGTYRGATSRRPGSVPGNGTSVVPLYEWFCTDNSAFNDGDCYTPIDGLLRGSEGFGMPLYGGVPLGSRHLVRHYNGGDGTYRGLYFHALFYKTDGDVLPGATLTVDGRTWMVVYTQYTYNGYFALCWDTEAE